VKRGWLVAGVAVALAALTVIVRAQTQTPPPAADAPIALVARADTPGAPIPSTLFGIFFEDINFAADGGIYPERLKNRGFEFPDALMGWKRAAVEGSRGTFTVATDRPFHEASPHYVRISSEAGASGMTNDGFRGIGVRKGESYRVSLVARLASDRPATLHAELENNGSRALGGVAFDKLTRAWARYTATIVADATDTRARFRLLVDAPGAVDVDVVSLFPADTWNGRPNGLRTDLVKLLKDLHPGFLRFPGGCIVEGRFLDGRYQWKSTIGDLEARRLIVNRWNDEFPFRPAPDYYQSFGLGFYEYFQLAEDIGAAPLPILNCGMACQFNSGELAPLDGLDPYIQDAIDLIEFANGAATTTWGARRAAMGHPAPFNLTMIGVGNEQWGQQYVERYAQFSKVLKAKHPEVRLVAASGPSPAGERFDFLWTKMRELKADLVDEHYYMPPAWFLSNVHRYDAYPRTGPKVFAGEYAAHLPMPPGRPTRPATLTAALAEAAFITGLERNADVVEMSSYAPLLAHVDAWQWSPNLIWFDNLRAFGTPSYHVQQLFGSNRGTTILPLTMNGSPQNGADGVFASAAMDSAAHDVVIKIVNTTERPRAVRVEVAGATLSGAGRALVLTGAANAENSLDAPTAVAPVERRLEGLASGFDQRVDPRSLTVLRLATR
jgi:alpha-N-arabinofuranosidase